MNKKSIAFGITVILCITVCLTTLCACGGEKKPQDVVPELINQTKSVSLVQKSFYPDYAELSEQLYKLRYGVENGLFTDLTLAQELEKARRELERLGYYYDYEGKTSVAAEDGSVYGASGADIGVGEYDLPEVDPMGEYYIFDDNQFYLKMTSAKAGDVFYIDPHADIDLSDLKVTNFPDLVIPDGVTIASGRGVDGEGGAVLRMSTHQTNVFKVGSNVRITGLVIQGPDSETHKGEQEYTESNGIVLNGSGIVIDNCEISGFSGAGLIVEGGDVTVRDCYIHHVRGVNGGSGILVKSGSLSLEDTVFANCESGVRVGSGARLTAKNNVEVGNSNAALFYLCEGSSAEIKNNTVLGYTELLLADGIPLSLSAEYNLLALNEHQYKQLKAEGIKNNAFNIREPYASTDGKKQDVVLTPAELTACPATEVDYGYDFTPEVVTVGGLGKNYEVMELLDKIIELGDRASDKNKVKNINNALTELSCFGLYYKKDIQLSQEIDGVMYGAYVTEGQDPIGGGVGYSEIFTTGDYVVDTLDELVAAAAQAKSGEVIFVEGHARIEVTSVGTIVIGQGVTLASDRGYVDENGDYSTGAVIWSIAASQAAVVETGDNARISGLVINGGDTSPHFAHHKRCYGDAVSHPSTDIITSYYALPMQDGICPGNNTRIDNCEILGSGHAGVHLTPETKNVRIDHCYIHHNQTNGLGYGICHNNGAESVIEYCRFSNNRHAIAGTGAPTTGYIARFNIEMGNDFAVHIFDYHGGADRGDGTDIAGTYCEMYNNTFLITKQYPYHLNGVPEDYQVFHHNILTSKFTIYDIDLLENERATLYDNIFDGELIR